MSSLSRLRIAVVFVTLVAAACTTPAVDSPPVASPEPAPAPSATSGESIPQPTPVPVTTTRPPQRSLPLPQLDIWAFPGPRHYEGDVLSFVVPLGGFNDHSIVSAGLTIDGQTVAVEAQLSGDPLLGDMLVFADVYATTGKLGGHTVEVVAEIEPGGELRVAQWLTVDPMDERPSQESGGQWRVEPTECCNLRYQENTAASRDLIQLVEIVDAAAKRVEDHFGRKLPAVEFVLIDRVWGNGGYAGDEVVVSYLDRDFSPGRRSTFRQTVLHELAHAMTDQLEYSTPWPLIEGVAVQFTQGHFKPEPLGPRVRALSDAAALPPLDVLFDTFPDMQHETRYVAVGGFTEFLVSEHGLDRVLDVFDSELDSATPSAWLDAASTEVLGLPLPALQSAFEAWIAGFDPLDQELDLQLTVALQEARRAFQSGHDPYPNYFVYPSVTETGQAGLTMRDPADVRLVAVEALIAYAQDLMIEGDLEQARRVVADIEQVVADAAVGAGSSGEFLAIAEAVAGAGYELISYRPQPGPVSAVAVASAPDLVAVDLVAEAGEWRVVGSRPISATAVAAG